MVLTHNLSKNQRNRIKRPESTHRKFILLKKETQIHREIWTFKINDIRQLDSHLGKYEIGFLHHTWMNS